LGWTSSTPWYKIFIQNFAWISSKEETTLKTRRRWGNKFKMDAKDKRVYPKVSGLGAWSENCKWYSSLPISAVVSLFSELV
jgi:hypothetical protein